MRIADGRTESFKCPYCGEENPVVNEFCSGCLRNLRVPAEVRAEARARALLAAAAAPEPAAGRPAFRFWGRAALICGLFAFYLQWLRDPKHFSFLDYVNLAFHEAGHLFLGFAGRFVMMLGGTVFQLLLPVLCLLQLRRKSSNIGWQLCLFWLGESLLNVSVYAADAVRMELPLVGGGEHDWNYLLGALGLLGHTGAVAKFVFLLGSAVIFYSFWLIARDAKSREPFEIGQLELR